MYTLGVAVLVINDDGEFLIGKRKGSLDAGCWGLPGGHLEPNETIEECAVREVFEETGLKITVEKHLGFTDDNYVVENKRYLTFFVIAELTDPANVQPQLMEPEKCEEWKWVEDEPPNASTPLRNYKKQMYTPL